jgi:Domain of Unknown Function (DUF1080)
MWSLFDRKNQYPAAPIKDRWIGIPQTLLALSAPILCLLLVGSSPRLTAQEGARPFDGSWDLTLQGAPRNLPSWINVSNANGKLKLTFVGVTDHATWMKDAKVVHGELTFVSPKGQEGFDEDTTYTLRRVGEGLEGSAKNVSQNWNIVGKRAPALANESVTQWGQPISLFDGKDFQGWRFSDPANSHWKIENGELVNTGHGAEIITLAKFDNFKLHLEFNAGPVSNSGVFLRGRYEVQIETDSVAEPPSHHTGGVYGFLDPTPEQPRVSDRWQTFDITFIGRTVTVVQNGIPVIQQKVIPGITGGALDSDEGSPGPIYLQGSEKGRVAFRNIVITPAKE